MNKRALILLVLLIFSSNILTVKANQDNDLSLSGAIKLYKSGNYSESYLKFSELAKNDIGNPLIYYYLAISSAQVGKNEEAIANYNKVIALSAKESKIHRYAVKGRDCLESDAKCSANNIESKLDSFIMNNSGKIFADEVKADYEKLKIENLMREMNRSNNIEPQRFKEYKDFSSSSEIKSQPSSDEIVAAIRTLQSAGLSSFVDNKYDLSFINGNNNENAILEMMGGKNLNPQLIQTMLTNNMSLGF